MTVKELIAALSKLPGDANVRYIWDGEARGSVEFVYLAKGGEAILNDFGEIVYSDESRPMDAPDEKQNSYWYSPSKPTEE